MKPWWKSKTLWLNLLGVMLTAGIAIAEANLASIKGLVSPAVYLYIAIGLAAANAGLRFITSQSIK